MPGGGASYLHAAGEGGTSYLHAGGGGSYLNAGAIPGGGGFLPTCQGVVGFLSTCRGASYLHAGRGALTYMRGGASYLHHGGDVISL
jgi:hypothetical protein